MASSYEKWQLDKFYPAYYRELYKGDPAIAAMTNQQLKQHYKRHGIYEGRRPNPFFDPKYYLKNYSDLRTKFDKPSNKKNRYFDALQHWLVFGIQEGRSGSTMWDPGWYLKNYKDVAKVFGKGNWGGAFTHFLRHGIKEGRLGSASFSNTNARFWKMRPTGETKILANGFESQIYTGPENEDDGELAQILAAATAIYELIKDAEGLWEDLKDLIGWLNPFD